LTLGRAPEVLDAPAERVTDRRQLPRTENQQNDQEDQQELGDARHES
jgi:hypothetical protein